MASVAHLVLANSLRDISEKKTRDGRPYDVYAHMGALR